MVLLTGSLAQESRCGNRRNFTTYSPIFVRLLLSVLIIVGALTFVPGDALGPISERLLTLQGTAF